MISTQWSDELAMAGKRFVHKLPVTLNWLGSLESSLVIDTMKVFKDNVRSDSTQQSSRGSAGTAGKLVNEADKIVDHI